MIPPNTSSNRVVVAMSGGVDSSVCAYLLKERGYEVIGITIKTWSNDECRDEKSKGCCSLGDISDARAVARNLDIPYYVLDLSGDFKEKVIDYFVDEYFLGRTPNPCIECNNHIKFGLLHEKAMQMGAQWIATGHYARKEIQGGRHCIREGVDLTKDQSYVLFGLTQDQLKQTLLPVGELSKKEVRAIAEKIGLRVHSKPDSQEICFVKSKYGDFVKDYAPERLPGQGNIVNEEGKVLGFHEGAHLFTVGQRKRLRLPEPSPYYVTRIRPETNEVVVGHESDLLASSIVVQRMNWQLTPQTGEALTVKIRSRHEKSRARIVELDDHRVRFEFDVPQKAVTPGQAAVFYRGENVLGGGWIERVFTDSFSKVSAA